MMEERVAGWGGEAPYLNQGEQGLNGGSGGGQQASAATTVAGVPLRGEQGDGEVNNPCVSASLGQLRRRKPPPKVCCFNGRRRSPCGPSPFGRSWRWVATAGCPSSR